MSVMDIKIGIERFDLCLEKLQNIIADHQTVHDRILDRGEKEGCWCMENIDLSREGTAALPGIHVATDDKSVVELYEWICNEIGIFG